MRYMMLIYSREGKLTPDQEQEIALRHRALMNDAKERGLFHGAEPLMPASTAITVRTNGDGKVLTTDGPFTETKEQLAGYYILDCESIDEAIEWAGRIPTGCLGGEGCVEIRPIWTMKMATT